MKTIVVGGHTRNIGKTSVMAGLIRDMRSMKWTAVKITQFGHGICSLDGEPCECAPSEHAFVLTEESNASDGTDTSRFLAAGAKRSLWLRVRQGQLAEAFPLLEQALAHEDWVMIESNSILRVLKPSLYLAVLDPSRSDFKPSALDSLLSADALVPIQSAGTLDAPAWPKLNSRVFENKPRFPVASDDYFSPGLCQFVREKLALPADKQLSEAELHLIPGKEQLCQH